MSISPCLDAQAEAHAVVAREVRRGLGRARRCSRWAARISCAAARPRRISAPAAFSHSTPCCHSFSISAGMPSRRYSLRDADPQAPTLAGQRRLVVRHRHVGAGACPSDRGPPSRRAGSRVAHGARHRPGLVERARRRRRCPSASSARRSASRRPCRRTPRAGGSSRRCRCRSRPGQIRAATAAAEPPDEPPGTRAAVVARARVQGLSPGRNSWSCWTSPWRTRRDWSCRASPRRRPTDWR